MAPTTVELTLSGFAYGGEALGRDENGCVVFVPFASAGERVRVEIFQQRKRWARGRLVQVLESSPDRIAPRCKHYTECGGCHYQHLPYTAQLALKADLVREQLQRLGGIPDPPVEPTVPSPSPWNARNQLQFSLDAVGRLGFVRAGAGRVRKAEDELGGILPIQECYLPEPILADLWPRLDLESLPGLERVSVRAGAAGQTLVLLHASGPPEVELSMEQPGSVLWLWPGGMEVLAGSPSLQVEVHGRAFRITASAFFQVNTALAGDLVDLVLEGLQPAPDQVLFDLYAGVGLFSAFLAEAGCQVIAVERDTWACEDFRFNLAPCGDAELHQARVERALDKLKVPPAGVVVDPPRSGLSSRVLEQLLDASPDRLVYVSCDPATLARDAKRLLAAGYRMERVTPVDLFPQTYHIECVSLFRH